MLAAQSTVHPALRRRFLWRVLWLAVLVLHAPATLSALRAFWRLEEGGPSWSSALLLAASNLFFILEIRFAYSLRLLANRRNAIVLVLVIVMLHVGVLEARFPQSMPNAQMLYGLLAGIISACEWRWILKFAADLGCVPTDSSSSAVVLIRRRQRLQEPEPRRPTCAWNCAPLRAPPLVVC